MTAINRRPQPAIIEIFDENGLDGLQQNFEVLFSENLLGLKLEEFEAELAALASGRSYLTTVDDGTLSVQAIPIPATDGGTGLVLYAVGDILYADTTTTLAKLADVAVGSYLRSGGVSTAPLWSTLTLPNAATIGDILAATGTNAAGVIGAVAVGRLLRSAGTGTLPAYSTFTIPDTFAQGDIIYGSATNVLTALAKDVNATRSLTNTGTDNAPAWAQVALATGVSGDLPFANIVQITTDRLLGRVSKGSHHFLRSPVSDRLNPPSSGKSIPLRMISARVNWGRPALAKGGRLTQAWKVAQGSR